MIHKEIMIDILSRAAEAGIPGAAIPFESQEHLAVYAELIKGGLLKGKVVLDDRGQPVSIYCRGLTAFGRNSLTHLVAERETTSFRFKAKLAKRRIFWTIVISIGAAIVAGYLIWRFGWNE